MTVAEKWLWYCESTAHAFSTRVQAQHRDRLAAVTTMMQGVNGDVYEGVHEDVHEDDDGEDEKRREYFSYRHRRRCVSADSGRPSFYDRSWRVQQRCISYTGRKT